MDTSHRLGLALFLYSLFFLCALQANAQAGAPQPQANAASAAPAQTPTQSSLDTSDIGAGLIKLDVVATDTYGKAVAGLQPWDFTLLDNGQPRRILSFQAFDGTVAKPEPPMEVILVIDTLDIPANLISR